MHKEVRNPTDDAPLYNPAAWRVRSGHNISSYNSKNASEASFLERLQETKAYNNRFTATTSLNGAGDNVQQQQQQQQQHQTNVVMMDGNVAAADDGNFVGMGAIGRTWISAYKVPPIETTEAELLAARAISAGEYRFVARMVMWAMWAILRSLVLLILPSSWKQAFLDSSMFTWSVKKDDKDGSASTSSTKGGSSPKSVVDGTKKREDMRSVSPSVSRRSATREDSKPFVF